MQPSIEEGHGLLYSCGSQRCISGPGLVTRLSVTELLTDPALVFCVSSSTPCMLTLAMRQYLSTRGYLLASQGDQ